LQALHSKGRLLQHADINTGAERLSRIRFYWSLEEEKRAGEEQRDSLRQELEEMKVSNEDTANRKVQALQDQQESMLELTNKNHTLEEQSNVESIERAAFECQVAARRIYWVVAKATRRGDGTRKGSFGSPVAARWGSRWDVEKQIVEKSSKRLSAEQQVAALQSQLEQREETLRKQFLELWEQFLKESQATQDDLSKTRQHLEEVELWSPDHFRINVNHHPKSSMGSRSRESPAIFASERVFFATNIKGGTNNRPSRLRELAPKNKHHERQPKPLASQRKEGPARFAFKRVAKIADFGLCFVPFKWWWTAPTASKDGKGIWSGPANLSERITPCTPAKPWDGPWMASAASSQIRSSAWKTEEKHEIQALLLPKQSIIEITYRQHAVRSTSGRECNVNDSGLETHGSIRPLVFIILQGGHFLQTHNGVADDKTLAVIHARIRKKISLGSNDGADKTHVNFLTDGINGWLPAARKTKQLSTVLRTV
jgi:hypothetical protein